MTLRTALLLVFLFTLAVAASGQVRYQSEIFPSYSLQSNIQYGQAVQPSGSTTNLMMDMYTGTGDHAVNRPLVIFIHGGGFKSGDKVSSFGTLTCGGLAKRGYVVASINYRLTTNIPNDTVHFEAMMRALQDAKSAVRYFRKNAGAYGVDSSQIFVTGSSAGSITAMHLAYLDSTEVPAWVNWSTVGGTFEGTSGNPGYSSAIQGVISNWGAIGDTSWMNNGNVPVFGVHGLADSTVYYNLIPADGPFLYSTKYYYQRAQDVGITSGVRLFANTGHTLDNNVTKQDSAYKDFSAWLFTILKNPSAGTAAKLDFGTQPTPTIAGGAISPPITIQIEDSLGNVIYNDTRSVSIAIGSNGGPGGVLNGAQTVSAINGVATFTGLSIDKAGTGYTLVATSAGLQDAESHPFTILSGGVTGSIVTTGSGNWSSTLPDAPWPGGIVPTFADNVTIADGHTVTIDVAANCGGLRVGQGTSGLLQFEPATARTITVLNDVIINPNAVFQSASSGTVTTHSLIVGGNLINDGALDFSTNSNTAGAAITFNNPGAAAFAGTGSVTDIRTLTIDKGTDQANSVEISPSVLTVQGTTTDGTPMGFLTINNGISKISGTFTMTARCFTSGTYTIPATGGFWLNNPNFTVAGLSGNSTNNGLLRVSAGVYNIGTASSNKMTPTSGVNSAAFIFEGGVTNVSGMLRAGATSNVTFTMTGGILNITTVGNAGSGEPGLGFTSTSNVITISGGTINLVQRNKNSTAANRRDYNLLGAVVNITGGVLNVGTAATSTNYDFAIGGVMPNVVIDNTGTAKTARLSGPTDVYGDLTISAGTTLDVNGKDGISFNGNGTNTGNIFNSGSIIGTTGSRLKFSGANGEQTYSGTGTFGTSAAPFDGITINNPDGVIINSPVVANRINLYQGAFSKSGNITLGNGGASAALIQIGNSASLMPGLFDVSPVFQTGTGGLTLLYGLALSRVTTGFEIPPSRTVSKLSVGNTSGILLSGGNCEVSDTLTLSTGNLFTGGSTISIGSAGAINRVTGCVVGFLQKPVAAGAAVKSFEVGDSLVYTPVNVTFGNVTVPGTMTASTTPGVHPALALSGIDPVKKLNRYYTITNDGITFDSAHVGFSYAAADLDPSADTSKLIIRKNDAGIWTSPAVTGASTTGIQASGITSFSDFVIGDSAAVSAFTLTINTVDGTVAKSPDKPTYANGDTVRLTATPSTGYHFTGWSGDLAGSTNPVTIVMDNSKVISAGFASNQYALTITAVHGSVTPVPQAALYNHGVTVVLTALPDPGYHFTGWSGDISGNSNPDSVVMTSARSVTASFTTNLYDLTASAGANGTISPSGNISVAAGGSQAYSISPAIGYHVDSLLIDGIRVDSTTSYTFVNVQASHSIRALFAINMYTLTVPVVGTGSVTKSPDLTAYPYGTVDTLTAAAPKGWIFSAWSGDVTGMVNPLIVTMDTAKSITATFVLDPLYQTTFRTFRPDSTGASLDNKGKQGKFVVRKNVAVDFTTSFISPLRVNTGLTIKASMTSSATVYAGNLISPDSIVGSWNSGKGTTVTGLGTNVTVWVVGRGTSGKAIKIDYVWAHTTKPTTTKGSAVVTSILRLPMPNRINVLAETMAEGGYGSTGMIVGQVNSDVKNYGWFQTVKYGDVLKTVDEKGTFHTGAAHGFDKYISGKPVLKQNKTMVPSKFNDVLLANMIGLKLSITASAMKKTPVGLGELIYDDGTVNVLNGKMVKEIAAYADSVMMGWTTDTIVKTKTLKNHHFADPAVFANVNTAIANILNAFEGAVDTVKFGDTLRLKGTQALLSATFLKANTSVMPAIITPLALQIPQEPTEYSLNQNYPNPFNPTTTIGFDLPEDAIVTLKIYNILGQEVATLLDRALLSGGTTQEMQFDAHNLASGVYFYRIVAEKLDENGGTTANIFTTTKKMMLLK